ncbi:MAG TPA: molybdate ABC transporter substrate-binding protein [Jatrophihabitans sp.]|nr:molybdate ABC transporter substrate-binding protein [Jatrophihabitans sp.]
MIVRAGCLLATTALVVLTGCGSSAKQSTSSAAPGGGGSSASAISGTITVLAAASLTEAFNTLAKQFEAAHPGVTVKLSFGASSALALQINQGAPADVFASAATKNMTQVISAGGASTSTNFVSNVMEIAVPPSNPAHITTLADLARSGVKVAVCQPQVPCGAVARQVFDNAKLTVKPVTLEADVKSTLTKVETNEVDAGVVYVTDVRSAANLVTGIPIDDSVNASTEYPIAALTKAPNPTGAAAFVAYLLSDAGQQVFSTDGFEQP